MKRLTVHAVLLFLGGMVLTGVGCTEYLRYDALPEKNLRSSSNQYLADFEQVFELENRYELKRMLYEDIAGQKWGANRLLDRMNGVFKQYDSIELQVEDVEIKPSSRRLIVKFNWTLKWVCTSIDPSTGCKDYDDDGSPDRIMRSGYTLFTLIRKNDRWLLEDEQGDLLLGSYEPGHRIVRR